MFRLVLLLISAWLLAPQAQAENQDVESRHHYGVLFRKTTQQILIGQSYYDLILRVPIPQLPAALNASIDGCGKKRDGWCKLFGKRELAQARNLALEILTCDSAAKSFLMSPIDFTDEERVARGLMDFVGKISRGLFGTATVSDVRRLAGKVYSLQQSINDRNKDQTFMLDTLYALANKTNAKFATVSSQIDLNHHELLHIAASLENVKRSLQTTAYNVGLLYNNVEQMQDYMIQVVERRAAIINALQTTLISVEAYLRGVEALAAGKLPPEIVHPHDLQSALESIKSQLLVQRPGFSIIREDLGFYYNTKLTIFAYTQNDLIIHVSVPIAEDSTIFDIYQTQVFPLPLHTSSPQKSGYTKVIGIPDILAVDRANNQYVEMDYGTLSFCQGNSFLICHFDLPRSTRPAYTCAATIFFHQDKLFKENCKTWAYPHAAIKPAIMHTGPGTYYVASQYSAYQSVCPDKTLTESPPCAFCQVSLPCGCTLYVGNLQITPTDSDCDPELSSIQILHTMNHAVFLHFDFPVESLPKFRLANMTMNMAIPNISDYVKNFTDLSNREKEEALDLQVITEAIKEERNTYKKQKDVVFDDDLIYLPFMDTEYYQDILSIVVLCIIILSAIGFVITFIKFRQLAALIALGYAAANDTPEILPGAESKPILFTLATSPTPTVHMDTETKSFIPNPYYYIMLIVGVAAFFFTAVQFVHFMAKLCTQFPRCLHRCRRHLGPSQSTDTVRMYLKMTNGTEATLLYLDTIHYESNLISFSTAPHINDFIFKDRCLGSVMTLAWSNHLTLMANNVEKTIRLRSQLLIPVFLKTSVKIMYELRKKVPVDFHLLLHCHGATNYVEIPSECIDVFNPPVYTLNPFTKVRADEVFYTPPTGQKEKPHFEKSHFDKPEIRLTSNILSKPPSFAQSYLPPHAFLDYPSEAMPLIPTMPLMPTSRALPPPLPPSPKVTAKRQRQRTERRDKEFKFSDPPPITRKLYVQEDKV